jgi:hypothetical protein
MPGRREERRDGRQLGRPGAMKELQESIKREPLIPAGALLDYMPGKAGTDG